MTEYYVHVCYLFYTPELFWYGVRPSVRPSVSHFMSAQYLEKSDSHDWSYSVDWSWLVDDSYKF